MSVLEQTQSVRWPENWPLETRQAFERRAKTDSITLADTLLIIQERRGTLYMLDMARYVIENGICRPIDFRRKAMKRGTWSPSF
jgi:hypothetical protein